MDHFDHIYKIHSLKIEENIEPILCKWAFVNDLIRENTGANRNWSTERACLSSLAGAIWQLGGFAIEEYSATKGLNKYQGRVDLMFSFNGLTSICEAKHGWLQLPQTLNLKDFKKEIENDSTLSLGHADADLKTTLDSGENFCDQGYAITFFVPWWKSGSFPEHQMDQLTSQLENVECDFYSMIQLKNNKYDQNPSEEYKNSIILIGRMLHTDS